MKPQMILPTTQMTKNAKKARRGSRKALPRAHDRDPERIERGFERLHEAMKAKGIELERWFKVGDLVGNGRDRMLDDALMLLASGRGTIPSMADRFRIKPLNSRGGNNFARGAGSRISALFTRGTGAVESYSYYLHKRIPPKEKAKKMEREAQGLNGGYSLQYKLTRKAVSNKPRELFDISDVPEDGTPYMGVTTTHSKRLADVAVEVTEPKHVFACSPADVKHDNDFLDALLVIVDARTQHLKDEIVTLTAERNALKAKLDAITKALGIPGMGQ